MEKFTVMLFVTSLMVIHGHQNAAAQNNDLKLQFNKPAKDWNEALPIGNGRIAAMVFGNPSTERLQLNEASVWAGEPGNNNPEGFYQVLPQIRQMIFEGKHKEAQDLAMQKIPADPRRTNYGMPYQTVGDLYIDFHNNKTVTDYTRELDLNTALCGSTYSMANVKHRTEVFASFTDQVIVYKITADQPGQINCTLRLYSPHKTKKIQTSNDLLILSGTTSNHENKIGRVKFEAQVKAVPIGGVLNSSDTSLTVSKADELTIYISIGTNVKNYKDVTGDEKKRTESNLNHTVRKKYDRSRADHIAHYQKYFNRVSFVLGTSPSAEKPTDQRLAEFKSADDLQFVPLYFQFGRYLLISSSQPGGQPATLQGLWNEQLTPPWDSKYTININTEMNYWPAESTGLQEMHEPLFYMLKDLSITGKKTAAAMYGVRGWAAHHNTDLWRTTGPVDGAFYGMWPMGGAWLSTHIWQHYIFSGDLKFLEINYDVLKGAALFLVDVLQEEPKNKWLVVSPSMSPENAHHEGVSIAAGTTMDNQLVFDVFSNFIQASKLLNKDKALRNNVSSKLQQLPPMKVGQHNQLQEWSEDWDSRDDNHRHVSHLYGLFPSNQITPNTDQDLFEAARKSLIYRGDKSTGWSMGWKVNLWARLLDGERAYKLIKDQLTPSLENEGGTYNNLLDAHPPFQIDGNFGCTSGIAEMLVQSHDGAIHLLPALPRQWSSGKITGLRTKGGFTIDIEWRANRLIYLKVHSSLGGQCRLRSGQRIAHTLLRAATGENSNPFFQTAKIKKPVISKKAQSNSTALPVAHNFDFQTKKETAYVFHFE